MLTHIIICRENYTKNAMAEAEVKNDASIVTTFMRDTSVSCLKLSFT